MEIFALIAAAVVVVGLLLGIRALTLNGSGSGRGGRGGSGSNHF